MTKLTRDEIMAARTPAGGWTKAQFAKWGITWPPTKGWIERLTKEYVDELPPDPEGMNDERAQWAETAIKAFMRETGTDPDDAVADLIADLMHLCDRDWANYGKFGAQLARAKRHYKEETTYIEQEGEQ